MIVVCSTSKILCDSIVRTAGPQVETLYEQQKRSNNDSWESDGGRLPCKKIVFRPWVANKQDPQDVKQSIDRFIATSLSYARAQQFSTLGNSPSISSF